MVGLSGLCFGRDALAQVPSGHAQAEALSEVAVSARAFGDTEQECARLEVSARLSPTAARLLLLADCTERLGKSATAWATYGRAAVLARRDGLAEEQARAESEAARLEPSLSRLSVIVPDSHRHIGLEVFQDGVLVDPALYGVGVAVDPGTHKLVARAPRHVSWSAELGVPAAPGTVSVTVPMLGLSVLPPARERSVAPASADRAEREERGSTQRTVGLVLAGAGVAAIAGGVVAAVVAANERDELRRACALPSGCSADLRDDVDALKRAGDVSTFLLAGGGLSLVSGVVVYLLAPSASKREAALTVAPAVAPGTAALLAAGRF